MIKNVSVYDGVGNIIESLVQYDLDVYIVVTDNAITQACPVHFAHQNDDLALVVNSTYSNHSLRVKIPNIMLRSPLPLYIYWYVDIDNGKRTLYRARINVIPRPQPADYIYVDTPDYISVSILEQELRDAMLEIENIKDEVESAKEEAVAAAEELKNFNITVTDDGSGNVYISLGKVGG